MKLYYFICSTRLLQQPRMSRDLFAAGGGILPAPQGSQKATCRCCQHGPFLVVIYPSVQKYKEKWNPHKIESIGHTTCKCKGQHLWIKNKHGSRYKCGCLCFYETTNQSIHRRSGSSKMQPHQQIIPQYHPKKTSYGKHKETVEKVYVIKGPTRRVIDKIFV